MWEKQFGYHSYSRFRPHPWVRLAQTGHLLTPFVDDAEGRSHDGSHANRAVIEINRKKPPMTAGAYLASTTEVVQQPKRTDREPSRFAAAAK